MENFIRIVSAIKDETRILILRFLRQNGETCVCELQGSFRMIQSRLSRHLQILKDAGFLRVNRRGVWAYYLINEPLDDFRNTIIREIERLALEVPVKIPNTEFKDNC